MTAMCSTLPYLFCFHVFFYLIKWSDLKKENNRNTTWQYNTRQLQKTILVVKWRLGLNGKEYLDQG
ncbi:hypothetical protein BDA99DRAFT_530715, partial [Phascolomyces articulosus]